jgi:hypothetical protein
MYLVAYGFFESGSKESWTWFLLQLHKAIGQLPLLVIHCDTSKGLIGAVKDVFPHAKMRECFRHLMQNFIKNFTSQEHMYPEAHAYIPDVYEHHKANVVTIDGLVHWFKDHHSLLWYQSGLNPDIKCDYITNNIDEVFNNWIIEYKDLLVCELVDKI